MRCDGIVCDNLTLFRTLSILEGNSLGCMYRERESLPDDNRSSDISCLICHRLKSRNVFCHPKSEHATRRVIGGVWPIQEP